jgi:hypothetical protein
VAENFLAILDSVNKQLELSSNFKEFRIVQRIRGEQLET